MARDENGGVPSAGGLNRNVAGFVNVADRHKYEHETREGQTRWRWSVEDSNRPRPPRTAACIGAWVLWNAQTGVVCNTLAHVAARCACSAAGRCHLEYMAETSLLSLTGY